MMQINLTGFLNGKKAREFMGELWELMLAAQSSPDGIPPQLVELKKKDIEKRQVRN
jgi:serine/arginine repetitive matrix protein 1